FLFSSAFFLYCYVARRDLHSFPTRRSSDLGPVGPGLGAGRGRLLGDGRRRRKRGSRGATAMTFNLYDTFHATARRLEGDVQVERSEEHTSELQSRSDLVCRLLLEKKKTTKI